MDWASSAPIWPNSRKSIDIGDYRQIRSKLGWCPRVSLAGGLRRTLAYYEEHRNQYWEAEA